MVDARKLKDEAAAAVTKGRYRRAAELYDQLAQIEKDDAIWPHRAGEAWRRVGDKPKAIAQLTAAADGYARGGFFLKAISVAKMILEIDPGRTEAESMLATLYARRDTREPTISSRVGSPQRAPSPQTVVDPQPILPPAAPRPIAPAIEPVPTVSPVARPPIAPPPIAPPSIAKPSFTVAPPPLPKRPPPPPPSLIDLSIEMEPEEIEPDEIEADEVAAIELEPIIEPLPAPRPSPTHASPPRPPSPPSRDLFLLPLNQRLPGARVSQQFSVAAFEIPLEDAPTPSFGLPEIPLFSSLDERQLGVLIQGSRIVRCKPGQVVVRQGARGDALYVVVGGSFSVRVNGVAEEVARLGEGEFFGELALLSDLPRVATVSAESEGEVLEISCELIWTLIDESPEVLRILLRFFRDRLIGRLVSTSPMFASFSTAESRQLAERFQFLELKPGAAIVREGERAEGLFVILLGSCEVVTRAAGPIALLGPGDLAGEISLLMHGRASASVTAATAVWALGMPLATFQEVILTHPQVLIYVNDVAESRRRADTRKLRLV